MNIYGLHKPPFRLKQDNFSLSFEKEGGNYVYRREYGHENVEKLILGKNKQILINPVEPLTKPKNITPFLLIKFNRPLVIDAKTSKIIYVTFPIEIGIFIGSKGEPEMLDTVTFSKPKYTLYGNPRSGRICRYFQSDVFTALPAVDLYHEGVMQLKIINKDSEWIEITKAVFSAFGMKIYHDDKLVSMKAEFEAQNRTIGETEFKDSPLNPEMKKSTELFSAKKLALISTKFVMEEGL